jgi:hypothetical protein
MVPVVHPKVMERVRVFIDGRGVGFLCFAQKAYGDNSKIGINEDWKEWLLWRPNQGKKRGQPFRITQSQLREVVIHIGFSAPKIKP